MAVPSESRSIFGSTAAACVEHARFIGEGPKRQRRAFRIPAEPVRQCDEIPEGTCLRCGMIGGHVTPEDCIQGLRDEIARLEFKLEKPKFLKPKLTEPESLPPASMPAVAAETTLSAAIAFGPSNPPDPPLNATERTEQREKGVPSNPASLRRVCSRRFRENRGKMEPMNHYAAVIEDLQRRKADAEAGIALMQRLMSTETEPVAPKAPRAMPRRPSIQRKAGKGPVVGPVLELLGANPETVFTSGEIAERIKRTSGIKSLRTLLAKLSKDGKIAKVGPGRFQARPV